MNEIIRTEKLCLTYSNGRLQTPVLFDIDLEIRQGQFVAIMGPSGCGKSTLMHILGLMLRPTGGQYWIEGQNVSMLKEAQRAKWRREKVGFVFQRFNLLPALTVWQNIAVAEKIRRCSLDGQIDRALKSVGILDRRDYKPGQLSIGQQQRVAIARAISHRPAILLADEPTGNLDSTNAEMILQLFRNIHEEFGLTIVMITHSRWAAQWAERIIRIKDGRIVP